MKRIKEFMSSTCGKVAAAVGTFGAACSTAFAAHAEGANEGVSAAQSLMSNVTSTLNITNMVAILGAGITAVIALVLGWWGVRKLIRMVRNAAFKGKLTV